VPIPVSLGRILPGFSAPQKRPCARLPILLAIVTGVLENRLRGLLPRVYFRRDYVASHRFLDASEVGSRDYDVSRSFSSSG
jgi:hypothetical protein